MVPADGKEVAILYSSRFPFSQYCVTDSQSNPVRVVAILYSSRFPFSPLVIEKKEAVEKKSQSFIHQGFHSHLSCGNEGSILPATVAILYSSRFPFSLVRIGSIGTKCLQSQSFIHQGFRSHGWRYFLRSGCDGQWVAILYSSRFPFSPSSTALSCLCGIVRSQSFIHQGFHSHPFPIKEGNIMKKGSQSFIHQGFHSHKEKEAAKEREELNSRNPLFIKVSILTREERNITALADKKSQSFIHQGFHSHHNSPRPEETRIKVSRNPLFIKVSILTLREQKYSKQSN